MLILLIGPKGSGKSHAGRILEASRGVHFFHVEPLWMAYYAECRGANRQPTIAEGIETVRPHIVGALARHRNVCIETTGASPEILDELRSLGSAGGTLLVRVHAPFETCLERIASRDPRQQILLDDDAIREVHRRFEGVNLPFDLALENTDLTYEEIVQAFRDIPQ